MKVNLEKNCPCNPKDVKVLGRRVLPGIDKEAKQAASAAYDDLSKEEWIHLTEYKHRLDRMLEIRGSQECL